MHEAQTVDLVHRQQADLSAIRVGDRPVIRTNMLPEKYDFTAVRALRCVQLHRNVLALQFCFYSPGRCRLDNVPTLYALHSETPQPEIVPLAQTVVAWLVSGVEILNRDLTETLPKGNGNGGFAANAHLVAVLTKTVVAGPRRLPAIPAADSRKGRLEYHTKVALAIGPGLVRHGDDARLAQVYQRYY